ncbi:MAG: trypsin-like peptidase domain-containing protein [Anaerolineae bacterium]|nr:trypsin-like peptidase domain-containing protein [Anaerolineae bacterium]MCO5191085.1 trypsin-like peptidase domain-containing protein [Anaerolineae bacterium]MCO5193318.1 trypsin-like peptidase domain-containing protein [Anaerolineae bacterium]MCO5207019.1 trypsin-like peptidase domain-containing protein [Anaerolineae bacterium]
MKTRIRSQIVILGAIIALFAVSCAQPSPSASAPDPVDLGVIETAVTEVVEAGSELINTSSPPTSQPTAAIAQAPSLMDLEDVLVNLYEQTNPSVVFILTLAGTTPLGSGSGFVFDNQGHVVTNNHVVADGTSYEIVFSNGERSRGDVIGADADADLAVIELDEVPEGIEPLPLADFSTVSVGQFAVAIGNPFGQQGSMSLGIISGLGRSLPGEFDPQTFGAYSLPQVIQTDAPINPGNSGGPLLNLDGEVIGINAAIRSDTGVNSGVGFSIPVVAVERIVPELIASGKYTYPRMGVSIDSDISLAQQEALGLAQTTGAYVTEVSTGTAAERAGLRGANRTTGLGGDLIVKMDGQEIRDFSDLNSFLVFETEPGQTIVVTVLRDGELLDLPLTLDARP